MNSLFSRDQRFSLLVKGWWNQLKTWLYHIHDFILLLLLSLLTERDELISIAIFLTTGYIGVFLIHKFMQKNNRICNTFSSSNRSFLFIFTFFSIWHNHITTIFLYRTCGRTWISSSKIFRWYCMVCRFSYILCTLSTVVETINVSLASYDYILVNRGQSQTTTITFSSIITIGLMSILIVQVFPFIRLIFGFITEVVALGFGYALMPLIKAAELKDTEDVWANKGHLLKPKIEDGKNS